MPPKSLLNTLRDQRYRDVNSVLVSSPAAGMFAPLCGEGQLNAGVPLGLGIPNGEIVRFDPFAAYAAKIVTSPNILVIGSIGRGKSTLVKLLLTRDGARPSFIVDPKGEYVTLAKALGWEIVDPVANGGMDLYGVLPHESVESLVERRFLITEPLIAWIRKRPLDEVEQTILRGALQATATNRNLTIDDVIGVLKSNTGHMQLPLANQTDLSLRLGLSLEEVAARLGSAIRRPNRVLNWNPLHSPGVVIDLSSWLQTSIEVLPIVMQVTISALQPRLMQSDEQVYLVVDEAWLLLSDEFSTRWLQRMMKLSRQWGVSVILVSHRASELGNQRDDVAARIAAQIANDVGVIAIAGLTKDAAASLDLLGISKHEIALVTDTRLMQRGVVLLHLGERWSIMRTVLGNYERELIDTDSAMRLHVAQT